MHSSCLACSTWGLTIVLKSHVLIKWITSKPNLYLSTRDTGCSQPRPDLQENCLCPPSFSLPTKQQPYAPWYARRIINTEDNVGWIREVLHTEHTPKKTPLCFPAPSNVTSVPGFGTELTRASGTWLVISSTHSPGKNPTCNKDRKRGQLLHAAFPRSELLNQKQHNIFLGMCLPDSLAL